jgi:hypothetical protein
MMRLHAIDRPRRSNVVLLAPLLLALTAAPMPAVASDFQHVCSSADGTYVMDDGALTTRAAQQAGQSDDIKYRVLQTIVLAQRKGHCVDERAEARGQKFEFESRSYVLRIAFRQDGHQQTTAMLCELAASGLPAAYNCDREVVTYDYSIDPKAPAEAGAERAKATPARPDAGRGTIWAMGDATLRLLADGAKRTFIYEAPTAAQRRRGVDVGSLFFEGQRKGAGYEGEAYTYVPNCGRYGYRVTGDVSSDGRRVVLRGYRPNYNRSCRRTGSRSVEFAVDLAQ